MPTYQYMAIAPGGKKVKGTIAAESAYAARRQLRVRSIHPSSITEVEAKTHQSRSLSLSLRKVKKTQIVDFTKQMAVLLNSGPTLSAGPYLASLCLPDQQPSRQAGFR